MQVIGDLIPEDFHGVNTRYIPEERLMVYTRHGWRRIEYIKQHITTKDMYEIETESGSSVVVTSDHSLFRDDRSEVKPHELRPGDMIEVIAPHHNNIVRSAELISSGKEQWVYDICTEDGTFVEYSGGIVLHNTDGIYVSEKPDINELNRHITSIIADTFGIESHMALELDEFGAGYFYKTKNYILEKTNGKLTMHGTAFKSSNHPQMYVRALERLCRMIIDGKEDYYEVVKDIKNWSNYGISDLMYRTTINMDPAAYSNPNAVQPRLARQAAHDMDTEIVKGDSIEYVVCKGNRRMVVSTVNLKDVDFDHYSEKIDKLLDRLSIANPFQPELF